jgi:hypothetical protein
MKHPFNYTYIKRSSLLVGSIISLLIGCVKTEQVSPIPHISFEKFELFQAYDTFQARNVLNGKLTFSFIDGNADIGYYNIEDTVTWNENNYNVFLKPFEKIDSLYFPIPDDSTKPPLYFTIAHNQKLDRTGQNKTVKGTISITITYDIIPPYDTIRYEFYIFDRIRNKSNVEVTSDIGFKGIVLSGPP